MTTERSYRTPLSPADAMDELRRFAGVQLDQEVVAAFLRSYPDPVKLPLLG